MCFRRLPFLNKLDLKTYRVCMSINLFDKFFVTYKSKQSTEDYFMCKNF